MTTMTDVSNSLPRHASLDDAASAINTVVAFISAVIIGLIKIVTPHIFTLAGLSSFVVAAFTFGLFPGLVVLGTSCFLLELRIKHHP